MMYERSSPPKARTSSRRRLNQRYKAGAFTTPSLGELRNQLKARTYEKKPPTFSNVIGDAGALHGEFPGATFQVASQFNCLEFVGPSVTPEDGVTGYAWDKTQGPCCRHRLRRLHYLPELLWVGRCAADGRRRRSRTSATSSRI